MVLSPFRRARAYAFAFLVTLVALLLPSTHALADVGDLTITNSPSVYVTDGGISYVEIKVRNNTTHPIEGVNLMPPQADDEVSYYTDEDGYGYLLYILQDKGCPEPVNATADEDGYTIAAGATATFYVQAYSYKRDLGSYTDYIKLGHWHYEYYQEYDPTDGSTWIGRRVVVDDIYTAKKAVTMTVYSPAGIALTVGTSTNTGATVTPLSGAGINFGNVSLSSGSPSNSKTIYVKNTSPTVDTHSNPQARPQIKVDVSLANYYDSQGSSPYHMIKSTGQQWYYNTAVTLGPDAWIAYDLSIDGREFIAGTYTATLAIGTVPNRVSVNGGTGSAMGGYAIPITVTFTGTNPNLPKRATSLVATPGNGQVELTWNAAASVDDPNEHVGTYYVWRREGTDSTNPDSLDWGQYECIGSALTKDDGTCLFVDGFAENGTTYTYTVIAGNPHQGYAAALTSATPKSSYASRLMAPEDFYVGEELGGVTLEWEMPEAYGGTSNDGSAQVDHFNVYRDGRLVAQIQQSAVKDEMIQTGWDDDGPIFSHEYGWEVFLETPQTGIDYAWNVAAVSKSGVEGYWTEGDGMRPGYPAAAVGKGVRVVSHAAAFSRYGYDDDGNEIPTISFDLDVLSYGDWSETMAVWRSVGTSAPSTSGAPYGTSGTPGISGGKHDLHLHRAGHRRRWRQEQLLYVHGEGSGAFGRGISGLLGCTGLLVGDGDAGHHR